MPESPEVQALADDVRERATGRVITSVDVLEFRAVKTPARPPSTLVGSTITDATRYGKHLDLTVGGLHASAGQAGTAHLGVGFGRHGWARWLLPGQSVPTGLDIPPALARIGFDDGTTLEFTDAGAWVSIGLSVVDEPWDVPAVVRLGPDPADAGFDRDELDRIVVGRRKQLKALLQDQESIAGIGSAYSDEILHRAKLSPQAPAATLGDSSRGALFDAVVGVVRGAIEARRGIPIDRLKAAKVAAMRVHGRAGEACPVCGDTIRDFAAGSVTAQYCPACQTGGRLLPG